MKRSGRPKGVKKKRHISGFVEKRSDAKRHRLTAARLEQLGEYQEKLTPGSVTTGIGANSNQ